MTITITLVLSLSVSSNKVLAQQLTQPIQSNRPSPAYNYRDRLTVDPEIDSRSIVTQIKNNIIDFVVNKLDAETFITELNQTLATITGDIDTLLDDYGIAIPKGRIGLPNVQVAKVVFDENSDLNILNDILGGQTGTTYSNRDQLYQQYLKQLSQEYSNNSALSLEGQSKIEAKIDSAISSAEQSLTIAEDSSGQDISQNIMRNISNQLALEQQANAMSIADLQDAKVDRSLSLQIQSEALTEISESNTRAERVANATNRGTISTLSLITIPGLTDSNAAEVAE